MPYWGGGGFLISSVAPPYVGPGDIVAGAYLWGGLRAYSNTSIGTPAINLRRDGDNATTSFVTLANGHLDVASIATFFAGGTPASSSLFCTTLYDQTGNGHDLVQATAANQAIYSSTSGPSSLPGLTFDGARLYGANSVSTSFVPVNMSFVAQTTPDGLHDLGLASLGVNAGGIVLQRGVTVSLTSSLELYDGNTFARINQPDNTWWAINTTTLSGFGYIEINGISAGNSVNFAADIVSTSFTLGQDGSRAWIGFICEAGIWPNGTSSLADTINSSQRAYWGF